ncbi:MAG: FadR/GntR family transcriptional regulator [Alphaproteobacteria bacterium]
MTNIKYQLSANKAPQTSRSRTYSQRSLHGQVAHDIGIRIVQGAIAAGQALPNEETLSAQLHVSRTALREAIKVLAAKGLVESRPKTGTKVRPRDQWNLLDPDVLAWQFFEAPDEAIIADLFEIREMLEPYAAALAAKRADAEQLAELRQAFEDMASAGEGESTEPDLRFHLAILDATRNEFLSAFGSLLESALAGSFQLSSHNLAAARASLPGHKKVLEAIEAHDGQGARDAMMELLDFSASDVRRGLERQKNRLQKS